MKKLLTLFLLLLILSSSTAISRIVFASDGNWIEVIRFEGSEGIQTDSFTCNYIEWRIRWSSEPVYVHRGGGKTRFGIFSINVYENDSGDYITSVVIEPSNKSEIGTQIIEGNGVFHLRIDSLFRDEYSVIVEQNTNSVQISEGKWIEVLSLSGHGGMTGDSPPFNIEHVEWRIKWEYSSLFGWDWDNDFDFYVYPHGGGKQIASISRPDEKNGTLNISYFTGEFHLSFPPGGSNWTVIVEQNTESPIQTENWVKVATLTGRGGISTTPSFNVDHYDWRILWQVEPDNETEWPAFQAYIFPNTGIKGSEQWFEKIENYGIEKTSGILRIYNHSGSFYMDVLASIDSYTMIIEQNIDSIPEFPSWTVFPICGIITLVLLVIRYKIRNKGIV